MEDEGSAAPFSLGGILSEPRIDGGEVSRSSIHGPLTSFTSLTSADLSGWRVRLVRTANLRDAVHVERAIRVLVAVALLGDGKDAYPGVRGLLVEHGAEALIARVTTLGRYGLGRTYLLAALRLARMLTTLSVEANASCAAHASLGRLGILLRT